MMLNIKNQSTFVLQCILQYISTGCVARNGIFLSSQVIEKPSWLLGASQGFLAVASREKTPRAGHWIHGKHNLKMCSWYRGRARTAGAVSLIPLGFLIFLLGSLQHLGHGVSDGTATWAHFGSFCRKMRAGILAVTR